MCILGCSNRKFELEKSTANMRTGVPVAVTLRILGLGLSKNHV